MWIVCWYEKDGAYSDYLVAVCDKDREPLQEPYECDWEDEAKEVAARLSAKTGFPIVCDF